MPWEDVNTSDIYRLVHQGERPSLEMMPVEEPVGFKKLMEACWGSVPSERPDFTTIVAELGACRAKAKPTTKDIKETAAHPSTGTLHIEAPSSVPKDSVARAEAYTVRVLTL